MELGVSLEASSLSPGIEVRLAYILPSPDSINSFTIGGIILYMVAVVVGLFSVFQLGVVGLISGFRSNFSILRISSSKDSVALLCCWFNFWFLFHDMINMVFS
ncbi:hypothetical protein Hanom_Chr14g01276961 [Helianthus anomalus]